VVWGMPGTAWKLGAAQELLALHDMAARIRALVAEGPRRRARTG
jgi:chemotaxis response regulator CheB